jgi:tetratricopeptide (TPR) repeat protein
MGVMPVRSAVLLIGLVAFVAGIGRMEVCAQGTDDLAALSAQVSQLHGQGRYAEGIPIAERHVALARQKLGEEHPEFATSLNDLAFLYEKLGRYGEAEPLYMRSLAIREKVLGPDHADVGESLNNLGGLRYKQGRQRALAIREKVLGSEHPDVAQSLHSLAGFHQKQGRYAQAELLYKRAFAISEKARWVPTTAMSPNRSTTWRCSMGHRVVTPRPSRSLSALSRSWKRR